MRLTRFDVTVLINRRKRGRWRSYRFYRVLAAVEIANMRHLRDFRSPAIFEFFNTIGAKRTWANLAE